MIAFLIYAINLSNPVKRLSQVYGNIQKALAAADRVFEILDTKQMLWRNLMLLHCLLLPAMWSLMMFLSPMMEKGCLRKFYLVS